MNDSSNSTESGLTSDRKRPDSLIVFGSVMWVICLLAIVVCWYLWRQRVLADKSGAIVAATKVEDEYEGDGRSQKEIRLVPQKDGTFEAKVVTAGSDDDRWDADGIEDFAFTDTDEKTVTKQDLTGKPFVISFVFTFCRGPCPSVTMQMRELQDRLKDYDFNLVTLTVDPERDTLDVLKQYGISQGADFERWKFLTGKQSEIYGLIQRSFKMPVEEVKGPDRVPGFEIIHSVNILLVNAEGRVIDKFDARKPEEMARLRKELKRICKSKPIENGTR